MNTLVLKILARLPWFKLAQWLLAETGWQRDVAEWLAAENDWYFRLAAAAWKRTKVDDPAALKADLLERALAGTLTALA